MNIFDFALEFVFKWEGGYCNTPGDPGGETKYGICKRAFPDLDIKNLTKVQAAEIYKEKYWNKCHCDDLPDKVAIVVFDFAVNGGPIKSIKCLQRAITDCGSPIAIDGIIGNVTLSKISKCNSKELLQHCIEEREEYYDTIVQTNSKLKKFRNGWQNRVNDLKKYISLDEE